LVFQKLSADISLADLRSAAKIAALYVLMKIMMLQTPILTVAPMMALTDRHCRVLHRLFSRRATLFTEMITAHALIHGDAPRFLCDQPQVHPVVFQLGGCDPAALSEAARMIADAGYSEVNLNVGCPSDRVKNGSFGAALMADPALVARCVERMNQCGVPVTVKCRLGIDDLDTQERLIEFVSTVADAGCQRFYVHARKAILGGLSPEQNRTIPPLDYDRVYDLKDRFPDLQILINGGITTASDAADHCRRTDGVMVGRAAYYHPETISAIANRLYGDPIPATPELIYTYIEYMKVQIDLGVPLHQMSRHLLGLYSGTRGARLYRRTLSDHNRLRNNDPSLVFEALSHIQEAA
jgi:tRNA-dihydrouridine synthase A